MSDEKVKTGTGLVKSYLNFLDTNVLFKKPVSCLFAIISLLIPVFFLFQIIQYRVFNSDSGQIITASILILIVLIFTGIFGALIWWYRRISRDEGHGWYPNFRRFIQTLGEWTATVFAIIVFFGVIIARIVAGDDYYNVVRMLSLPLPSTDVTIALFGLVGGFLIIIATKIFLFLLDPIVWLIKQIWYLIVRIVKYFYRCVIKIHGVFEQNATVWIGVHWLISVLVVSTGLFLCYMLFSSPYGSFGLAITAAIIVALGLVYMGFLVTKRKNIES